jgi:monovalent cation/hydrogen antiporter
MPRDAPTETGDVPGCRLSVVEHLEYLIPALLVAVAALSAIATRLGVPYPIPLLVGGVVIGLIPGIPHIELPPELVLAILLPPLLYSAAFFANLRDLRADLRAISLLAVGLVLATTVAVAVAIHALVPAMPWAVAFALGAIVSPTDPLAASEIARRQNAPRRVISIVEGESLINDGTALTVYNVAVAAAAGAAFDLLDASGEFVVDAGGGIALGIAVGWVIAQLRSRLDDPPVEITISLVSGYAAYLPAEALGLSGVLAAVTCGIYVGWRAPVLTTATTRLQSFAVWENLIFLLNALLFVLVGLQLGVITDDADGSLLDLVGYATVVSLVVIVVRIAWVNVTTVLVRAIDRRASQRARRGSWRERLIVAWSGMRGSVALAAALALPEPFPYRDLIIFCTFGVIFATLVLQGLSLPWLISRLGVHDDGAEEREEIHARLVAARAALDRLDALGGEVWTRDDTIERMRGLYAYRKRRFAARVGKIEDDGYEDRSTAYQQVVREVLEAQRQAVVQLRNAGEISNDVMHRIERELDLEDSRLEI